MSTKITTDGKWKDLKHGTDVPKKVLRDWFDYLDDAEDQSGYFRYQGTWYHLSQFMRGAPPGWDGALSESATTGVLIQISPDGEQYRVASFRN